MINTTRPILNLDLDLLRTFVAVADLNTFAAAAAAVCRTQSAVSQQMQRLEQLVGKELFARHGRNKLLTEQGIQLLGYARKILRFNDEACMSLMYGSLQGALSIGASEETADTILPFLLNRIGCFYPRMTLEIKVHPHAAIMEMLAEGLVDLALTTHQPPGFTSFTLRTSPTLWYCAAEYVLAKGESIPLILLEELKPIPPGYYRRAGNCSRQLASGPRSFLAIGRESGGEGRAGRDGAPGRNDEPGSTRGWHQ